jgi:hypothetical protein
MVVQKRVETTAKPCFGIALKYQNCGSTEGVLGHNAASWKQSATCSEATKTRKYSIRCVMIEKRLVFDCGLWNDRSEKSPQNPLTHQKSPMCVQSLHCYCYLLERLINIWAYHSGRRMLHVNVDTVGRPSPANFAPSFTFKCTYQHVRSPIRKTYASLNTVGPSFSVGRPKRPTKMSSSFTQSNPILWLSFDRIRGQAI